MNGFYLYFLVLFIVILIMVSIQVCNYKKRIELEINMQNKIIQNDLYNKKYKKIYDEYQRMKYIKHDFTKHINYISFKQKSKVNIEDNSINLINLIVDLKNKEAIQKKIRFLADIGDVDFDISEPDMVSLLSNLIDNSIEACEKVNSDKKSIYFTVKENNITLLNDKIKEEKPLYNNFFTSKTEKKSHGYGMKIIRDIVKKYNGDIQVEDLGDKFQLIIEFCKQ